MKNRTILRPLLPHIIEELSIDKLLMSKVHAGMRKWIFRIKTYSLRILLKNGDFTKNSMPTYCVDHNESLGEILKDKTP